MQKLPTISNDKFKKNNQFQSQFYFSNLYVLVNANRLSSETLETFVTLLIEHEEKIPPKLSLIIFGLFSIFRDNKKSVISKDDIKSIDNISKKLVKKYSELSREIFQFKSKIDLTRIKNLRK